MRVEKRPGVPGGACRAASRYVSADACALDQTDGVDSVSPHTKNARRCTNPDCEYGNRWVVNKMRVTMNGRLLCTGKGCHSIYDPVEVIDPESPDYAIYVR